MPVVIQPSDTVGRNADFVVSSEQELLKAASKAWTTADTRKFLSTNKRRTPEDRKVLHSSFGNWTPGATLVPYGNGFVDGVIRAFNQDLHLVLRPDDVWLAILTQFSQYVAGNAEELRRHFVEHDGKQKLCVDVRPHSMADLPVEKLALQFTHLIQSRVVDPDLRDWMLPKFTTTTSNDAAVAAMVMMGAMQHYFEYLAVMGCGFPSVTLFGEKSDWEEMVRRAESLPKYGEQAREWSTLLIPVLERMARSFDEPKSQEIKDFWLRPAFMAGSDGSMVSRTLSGWLTAFCFWNEEGKRVHSVGPEQLKYQASLGGPSLASRRPLVLDGVSYPMIHPEAVPKSIITVPVICVDVAEGKKYETTIVAGSVGMDLDLGGTMVQPRSGWWMLQDSCEDI